MKMNFITWMTHYHCSKVQGKQLRNFVIWLLFSVRQCVLYFPNVFSQLNRKWFFVVSIVDNSSPHLVDSQALLSETSDPIWGQTPLASAETGHTDMPDSSVLSAPMMADPSMSSQTTSTTTVTFGAPSLKIKQEEAEVEIVCVKDEPAEAGSMSRLEYSNPELHHQVGEPELGLSLDLPASFQALQSPGTSADLAIPAFINMDPTTCKYKINIFTRVYLGYYEHVDRRAYSQAFKSQISHICRQDMFKYGWQNLYCVKASKYNSIKKSFLFYILDKGIIMTVWSFYKADFNNPVW